MSITVNFKKDLPYKGTKTDWRTTQGQISLMIENFARSVDEIELNGIAWATNTRFGDVLQFELNVTREGVKKRLGFEFKPPDLFQYVGRGRDRKQVPAKDQAYRLLFWYLKDKLQAVRYGLIPIERELEAQILVSLPDGSKATLGDIIAGYIENDALNALPAPAKKEDPPDDKPKEVNAEFKVVEE